MNRERISLLYREASSGLSVFFATLCMVDIFGVLPIIALPRAIIQCGWFGIPLVLLVFGLQIYTAMLLGKSWIIATTLDPHISRKNRYPLAAVTELTLGSRFRTCVTVLLDLAVFGGGIPNLLVASQNLQLFGIKISEHQFDLSYCYWLLIVGILLCPIMWLGSPRDMKWIASFSCTIVALTAILTWWCIVMDNSQVEVLPIPTSISWDKFVSGYGILAFQFDLHPTLMTVQVDMQRPRDIHKAVISSFLITGSLFGITTALAVWKYGGSTPANILQLVSTSHPISIAILLSALQLCLSSALGHSALFQHLEDQLHVQRSFGWKRCAMRSAIIFFGVALAESVPRFDVIMALIGGSLTGPLIFVLPPLMYTRARGMVTMNSLASTPDVFSTSERRRGVDTVADPRVHSQSVYYGFLDTKMNNPNRYSYVYYDNDQSSDYTDCDEDGSSKGIDLNLFSKGRTVECHRPILVDASRSSRYQRIKSVNRPQRPRFAGNLQMMKDWFGYCVVILGILITISSTYVNVSNTIKFVQFTPSCVVNATVTVNRLNLNNE